MRASRVECVPASRAMTFPVDARVVVLKLPAARVSCVARSVQSHATSRGESIRTAAERRAKRSVSNGDEFSAPLGGRKRSTRAASDIRI